MHTRARLRTWAGNLLLLILSPAVLFGLLEIAGRVAGVTPLAQHPSYRARDRIRACRLDPVQLRRCSPEKFPDDGRTSVFVFGGSSVLGHPFGERRTITHYLQASLDAAYPGQYAVHNLGMMCKDSIFVRSCVERLMAVPPEVMVIYSGHNDFGGFTSRFPRAQMFMERHPWVVDLERALASTRAYSLVARPLVLWTIEPNLMKALPDWDLGRAHQTVLDEYTRNISAVIAIAGQRGVPVVLVTVVSNLLEFPFRAERWDAVLEYVRDAHEPLEPWLAHFLKGVKLFRTGQFEQALVHFKRSRDTHYPTSRATSALNERLRVSPPRTRMFIWSTSSASSTASA